MALKECKECGKEISNQAKTCPHCGISKPIKKPPSKIVIFGIIFLVIVIILGSIFEKPTTQTLQPLTRAEIIEKSFSSWDGSHFALTRIIKDSMNDPKSYNHIETSYNDYGKTLLVKTKFRGKNVFGGMVINEIIAKIDVATGDVIKIISQK